MDSKEYATRFVDFSGAHRVNLVPSPLDRMKSGKSFEFFTEAFRAHIVLFESISGRKS